MIEQSLPEESIFLGALDLESAAERAAYLDQACGDNVKLRAEVEALLRANLKSGDLLDLNEASDDTIDRPIAERPGTIIGPYKLLQQIGEGGMGVVFMAEQTEPLQRTVALKIIKPGMDTRQVIARFEAERQALAMMDHPNIAKVLDAGTTDSGRPYFLMELVKGVPITQYCDEKHLPLRERLELLLPVCQAVQHAHQKGIIHRDIKPTNVLVAEYDNHAVPKVIDFGVAKAAVQKLTERTMFTEFGQVLGTMEYMSPEQAKLNQLDIDTRSDIYSLGVLLYELLTGETPFDRQRLHSAALDEMLRIIREEEPPKPSTRLTTSDALPSIAANRHVEPHKLTALVRGELDWIVMKCLEKDRNRRYETATGLAADLQHHLHDEPVQACPPTVGYRLRKFTRKHRLPLTVAAGFVLLLLAASVVSSWQAVLATRARRDADAARQQASAEAQKAKTEAAIAAAVNEFLTQDLLGQDPRIPVSIDEPYEELKFATLLDRAATKIEGRFKDQPLVEAAVRHAVGWVYYVLNKRKNAEPHLRRAVDLRRAHLGDDHPDTLCSMTSLALSSDDVDLMRQVEQSRRRVFGENDPKSLLLNFNLALLLRDKGETAEAIAIFRETLARMQNVFGEDHRHTAWTMHCLGHTLAMAHPGGEHDAEIEPLYRHALAVFRKVHGDGSWYTFDTTRRLAQFLSSRDRYEEAEVILQDGIDRMRATPAAWLDCSQELARDLKTLYQNWGKPEQAAEYERQYLAATESALAYNARLLRENLNDPHLLISHASLLSQIGRHDEAEAAYRVAIGIQPDDPRGRHLLGMALFRQSKLAQAEAEFRESIRLQPNNAWNHHWLGDALKHQSKWVEAEAAYREAIRLDPTDAGRYVNLGDTLVAQGKGTEALMELQAAVQRQPASAAWQRTLGHFLCYTMGEPDKALPMLQEAARLDPNNPHAHYDVGSAYAFTGQWDSAAPAYRRAVDLDPNGQPPARYRLATLCLYTGDLDGYRAACREMLQRFGTSDDPYFIDCTAKICLLVLDADGNRERALTLADRNVLGTEKHRAYRWFVLAKGLADCRAGQYAGAVKQLEQFSPKADGGHSDATGFAVLAMAQHRVHQAEKAHYALASARGILSNKMPNPAKGRPFGDDWPDWLHSQILVREAEGMIEKEADESSLETEEIDQK